MSWVVDQMPSHGYRVYRDGAVLKEHITNDVSGVELNTKLAAVDILARLNTGSTGSEDVAV